MSHLPPLPHFSHYLRLHFCLFYLYFFFISMMEIFFCFPTLLITRFFSFHEYFMSLPLTHLCSLFYLQYCLFEHTTNDSKLPFTFHKKIYKKKLKNIFFPVFFFFNIRIKNKVMQNSCRGFFLCSVWKCCECTMFV